MRYDGQIFSLDRRDKKYYRILWGTLLGSGHMEQQKGAGTIKFRWILWGR